MVSLRSSEARTHTILGWATCGKCSTPRCFEVLVSDFCLASPQNFSGASQANSLCADKQNELSRFDDKQTNKINSADMLLIKVKGASNQN